LEAETAVRIGDPASEILEVAEDRQVDLIVINSRGGEGVLSHFLGSVAAKVAGALAIPVFVLHAGSEVAK
jgi:nucleotide-binding universal stress UspA family protein